MASPRVQTSWCRRSWRQTYTTLAYTSTVGFRVIRRAAHLGRAFAIASRSLGPTATIPIKPVAFLHRRIFRDQVGTRGAARCRGGGDGGGCCDGDCCCLEHCFQFHGPNLACICIGKRQPRSPTPILNRIRTRQFWSSVTGVLIDFICYFLAGAVAFGRVKISIATLQSVTGVTIP